MGNAYSRLLVSSALAGVTMLLACPAFAEAAPASVGADGEDGDVIVITAQRREQNIHDAPVTVTAASGDFLAKLELRTSFDAARIAPNANAWATESRARPRWFIRGIGSNDVSSNVVTPIAIYFDEVYQNHFSLQGFPLFDLDRVEILRGPGGTLWGKNTTGGALLFVSRKPTDTPEGYARVTVGNYKQRVVEGAFGGPITENITGRASFYNEHRAGYATNDVTGNSVGGVDDTAGRIQVKAQLSDTFSALLSAHYRKFDGSNTPVYTIGTTVTPAYPQGVDSFGYPTPTDPDHVQYNQDSDISLKAHGGALTANWELGGATLTSISAVESADRHEIADGDYTPNDLSRSYARTNVDQFSQELRLTSNSGGPLEWIVGAYYFRDKLHSFGAGATLPNALNRPLAYYFTEYTQKTTSGALFGNLSYKITDRLTLSGGLRWTHDTLSIDLVSRQATTPITFRDTVNWYLPTSVSSSTTLFAAQDDKRKWSALGYEVRPEFRPTDNVLLFARFAKGYRSGNFQGNIAPPSTRPNVIQPEKVYSYEAGIKTSWFDDRLTFNATAFYYDYKDIQTTVTGSNGLGQTVSIVSNAQGWVKGGEFELTATPVTNLKLTGNVGLLDTKYTELFTGVGGARSDLAGNQFARAPKLTSFVDAEYRIPFSDNDAIVLGTDWRYNSKFKLNALVQNLAQLDVRSYWLGNVRAGVQFDGGRLSATAYVNNVTDKDYKIHTLPAGNGSFKRMLGDPRTYGITLGARF